MLKPYFKKENPKLKQAIIPWLGTPYHHMGYTLGGVDCARLVGLIYKELGVFKNVDLTSYYSRDWHIHGDNQLLLNSIRKSKENLSSGLVIEEYKYSNRFALCEGDLVCISMLDNGIYNHVGIYLNEDNFFHCMQRSGTIISQFSYNLYKKAGVYFRLYREEN